MKTVAVRYYSRTGNTQKVARAIAEELGLEAEDLSSPLLEKVDVLFLGSAVYAAGVDGKVKTFLEENRDKIGIIYNFSTAALLPSTYKQVKKIAQKLNIPIASEEFHCRGRFKFLRKDSPNETDLQNARNFAKSISLD